MSLPSQGVGFLLIGIGCLIIRIGGRWIGGNAPATHPVLQVVSHSRFHVTLIKWVIGLLAVWFGMAIILTRGQF